MIDPDQAARMRETNALLLTTPAVIWRNESTSDGEGGQATQWVQLASTVCMREAATRQQITAVIGDRVSTLMYWAIELPVDQAIQPGDRVSTEGRTFDVIAPVDDSYGLDLVVLCAEVV